MQMFEYVIVLTSIVIGLALTHLMQGIAGLIQHPGRDRVWWVHLAWVAHMFLSTIFWWWWEFRLQHVAAWTFAVYFFVIFYAFYLYLICAILFPKDIEGYDGYQDYFLSRRGWFFGLLIGWLAIDLVDTLIKGADYFASLGLEYIIVQSVFALFCVIGIFTRRTRVQAGIVLFVLGYQVMRALRFYDTVS
jgi:hypothetical protein